MLSVIGLRLVANIGPGPCIRLYVRIFSNKLQFARDLAPILQPLAGEKKIKRKWENQRRDTKLGFPKRENSFLLRSFKQGDPIKNIKSSEFALQRDRLGFKTGGMIQLNQGFL